MKEKNYDYKKLSHFKWYVLENFPFIEEDFDAITNYELFCKLGGYLNQTITIVNELGETVETFTDYVSNYFENLDVQEEINNKLDEMADDGTLQEIIESYINLKSLLMYDNVASMKLATNLINGSYAKTLGYYSKNDGGMSTYKIRTITNDDIVDESTIIALADNSLIAELIIEKTMTPEQFGCYGDDTHDDTQKFQIMLNKILDIQLKAGKVYKITDTLTFRKNTKIVGCGVATRIKSYIDDDGAIFYNEDSIAHFYFDNFYIDGNNKNAYGFIVTNPYDQCIIQNIYFDNFKKSVIKMGTNDAISQTLLLNNNMIYMSNTALDIPIIDLTKCYESNITNNKLLNRTYNSSPCLLLTNIYDNNIQGNSFALTSDCAIKITGTESRHNRIISNTYEAISGEYSIKLDGTSSDAIQYTIIIESYTYYNAPDKIYCNNETQGFFIGMASTGGRRNMILNNNSGAVQNPYGNNTCFQDGGAFVSNAFGITNYSGQKQYQINTNTSAQADYGMDITDTKNSNKKLTINMANNWFGSQSAGVRFRLISPDGTKSRYLGIDNNGDLQVYSTPS